ncbi:6788_t:CDS:2, partial [Racocetra persica]
GDKPRQSTNLRNMFCGLPIKFFPPRFTGQGNPEGDEFLFSNEQVFAVDNVVILTPE